MMCGRYVDKYGKSLNPDSIRTSLWNRDNADKRK
jgi:hypothetical protein